MAELKPWEFEGLTIASRAFAVVVNHHCKDAEQSINEAIEAAVAQALRDAAPRWIKVSERYNVSMFVGQEIYIADSTRVALIRFGDDVPSWATHWAPCPPRVLPAPPQEDDAK